MEGNTYFFSINTNFGNILGYTNNISIENPTNPEIELTEIFTGSKLFLAKDYLKVVHDDTMIDIPGDNYSAYFQNNFPVSIGSSAFFDEMDKEILEATSTHAKTLAMFSLFNELINKNNKTK